jgi:hypothetical protein
VALVSNSPQRTKLLKAVTWTFSNAGWVISRRDEDSTDFRVEAGTLNFLIKCVDETSIHFDSPTKIVTKLAGYTREHRNLRSRQLIVVFSHNFLGTPLDKLIESNIFALTLADLNDVTNLIGVSNKIPEKLSRLQFDLLARCVEYALFVSHQYRTVGDLDNSIIWAKHAVQNTGGFTNSYIYLFELLKSAGDLEGAAKMAEQIIRYRPDDPQFLQGMADLARKRGDKTEEGVWLNRQLERPTFPRTLDGILAKQRQTNGRSPLEEKMAPALKRVPSKSGFGRLLKSFLRLP